MSVPYRRGNSPRFELKTYGIPAGEKFDPDHKFRKMDGDNRLRRTAKAISPVAVN
jgi:hypothetical protein